MIAGTRLGPARDTGTTPERGVKIGEERRKRTFESTRGDGASQGERVRRAGLRKGNLRLKLDADIFEELGPNGLATLTQIRPVAPNHRRGRSRLSRDGTQ